MMAGPSPAAAVLLAALLAASSVAPGNAARLRPSALPARRTRSDTRGSGRPSLHGFASVDHLVPQLESSIFLYRGGSGSDYEDEVDLAEDHAATLDPQLEDDPRNDNEADNIEAEVEEEESHIQVTSSISNAPQSKEAEPTVETSTHTVPRKKSNAVGDPDGNSSDDDSDIDDDEELEELDELERELRMLELEKLKQMAQREQPGVEELEGELETLVEMAARRDDSKRRIEEMEREIDRRRREGDGREEGEGALDADEGDEGDGLEEDANEEEGTSYHLAGRDVAKEDAVLKRERKYRRGSLFPPAKRRSSSEASAAEGASSTPPAAPSVATTISQDTFDEMLVSAFQSMVYLPPPSPRLPSPEGSVSLRNVDVSARRRLDRRTLYHGLLAELGGSHVHAGKDGAKDGVSDAGDKNGADGKGGSVATKKDNVDSMIRRRYLAPAAARALRGALGLACQPRWRERLAPPPTAAADAEKEKGEDKAEVPAWWHRGGVCLFPPDDDEHPIMSQRQQSMPSQGMEMGGAPRGFFGPPTQEDDDMSSLPSSSEEEVPWRCPLGMQETVALAVAHSLSCGMALLDDEALDGVRAEVAKSLRELAATGDADEGRGEEAVAEGEKGSEPPPTVDPDELKNAALIGHLVRLADEGKLGCTTTAGEHARGGAFGRISHRMARDMDLGLDDPSDELAVESLRLMREDERHWYEPLAGTAEAEPEAGDANEDEEGGAESDGIRPKPTSLVLFLRSDASSSILRSKSAVDALARECVRKDGIHLLVLGGRGVDAATTTLPDSGRGGAGARAFHRQPSILPNNQPRGPGGPFGFMSSFPPGTPQFHEQMRQNQPRPPGGAPFPNQGAGGTAPQFMGADNANASGMHDPDGSRRFNIFLARTVDPEGRPQITGTVAPPGAGNLFPAMLAEMAKENLRRIDEGEGRDDGDDDERKEAFRRQMEDLAEHARQHMKQGEGANHDFAASDGTNAAFFNATITSPFGAEIFQHMMHQQQQNEDGEEPPAVGAFLPPPEVQKAMRDAMSGVIERLAQMSAAAASGDRGGPDGGAPGHASGVPFNVARAFSQVLASPGLRRGIAENLSRAAPALVDPRCQGVMLSVYVPPGPEHPNRGMMPGDQYNAPGKPPKPPQGQPPPQGMEKGGDALPHGMGGWLNKILHSSDKGKEEEGATTTEEQEESADKEVQPEEKQSDKKDSEKQGTPKSSSRSSSSKRRKRDKNMDRARTLAVAAAALAGAKKNKKDAKQHGGTGGSRTPVKLTPEQRAARNLMKLQALCRSVPIPAPIDPVRKRAWEAWSSREEGAVIFRNNKRALLEHLTARGLGIDVKGGTRGAGIVLRKMMSVRDISAGGEVEDVIRCAVEIEAGRSQRHHESPWGVAKPASAALSKPSLATDKSLVNFLQSDSAVTTSDEDESSHRTIQFIHPNSLESALSLICGVSPSPGSSGSSSSSGALASHRSREDLMALAQDKHERALIPNCVSPGDIGVTYDMIGGLTEVKELLRQSITYPLKFPHLYSEGIAREAVKGVLLFGPPGTGKTMLAKAVATEGGASFLSVDASSVENKWLGESEKNAKAVFTLARRLAPCVIFIDEVDSLLSSREGSSDDSAHGTLTSVKTTMMSEWDGLNSGTNGVAAGSDRVVVIGSTNRPFDLDEAVLRRFPRRILVDLPDLETRREILEVTLAENRLGPDVNLTAIAERLEGYTGSDLKEVCREAVVQISHEQARMLDRGEVLDESDDEEYSDAAGSGFQMLRPVTMKDFESAMRKLKRSVSETGRELAKVWDWNDEYGEIKKTSKRDALPQMMNMFL